MREFGLLPFDLHRQGGCPQEGVDVGVTGGPGTVLSFCAEEHQEILAN